MSMDGRMVNVDGTQGKGNASEGSEGGEGKTTETSSQKELDGSESIEPRIGMEFESDDDAKLHYDAYARHVGFSTRVGQSSSSEPDNTVTGREFVCASKESSKRKNVSSCTAMLKVERSDRNKWVVIKFVKEHNHQTGTPNKVHSVKPRKHLSGVINDPGGAMSVPMDRNQPNHIPVEGNHSFRNFPYVDQNRAVRNAPLYFTAPSRKRTLGRDAQNLLDYFKRMQAENHGFFYAIQLDNDNHMTNVFWADARSRTAYSHFGDAVTFDTMYRWYKYRVPFAPFTGVNHHGEMILFGCALLLDESEASFIWLFKTFLVAMSDRRPVSITTDQDRAIQTAVSQVLPETRHRICKWHILREGQERLAHVCIANPTFQGELYNCINLTETIEEFESSWIALLDKYNLSKHDWLQALYNARQHWVPVYFRNTFFGSIFSNQEVEKIRSFFDGYVNQETTLPLFFRQYERALENWFNKEIEADFDTICTTLVLKTPSPMEKQAANIYTKKVFVKFQEELVETFVYTANKIEGDGAISTYRVAKFEDDNKSYIVTFNVPEMRTSCSCQMFEFSGILCRHVLTVFTVTNILTLPSHYILKRWTRNARSLVGSDEYGGEVQGGECLTKRYNSLCQEAIKYAEEGAITTETYTVAMGVLREGGKKVSVMKKNIASVQPPNSQIGGSNQDDNNRKMPVSLSDISPLWPRQEDVTRSFNLNDVGAPTPSITDLNLPHMTPVSLHRDGGLPDNMVVLPCLKSMTWNMENRTSSPENRVAVIILKLLDYNKGPSGELEVKFQLSSSTLEPMLRSMAYINEQLSTPANRIAVINLKLQDSEAITGESEVKFQVSRDTLGAMLRSMAYIREQLSCIPEPNFEPSSKKQR